ncbi:MAG: hypothetical protein HFF02_05790 [Erysipelotrichaceae bacterium]|nr:hypothetical protein [Erysipelotrichaceae bacterium]
MLYLMNVLIFPALGKNIRDITNTDLLDKLAICNIFNDMFRWLGKAIYSVIGGFADVLEACFEEISKIDFSNIVELIEFEKVLDKLTWVIIVIMVVIAAMIAIAKMDGSTDYIQYTVYAMVAILLFGTFNSYVIGWKNTGVDIVNETFKVQNQEKYTMSERIFYDNCYDMLLSIQNNQPTKVTQKIPISEIDINETLSKKDLQGKRVYDIDGTYEIDDLYDGIMNTGLNEERYYRYNVNMFACIFVLLVCMLVMLLCMIKLAYVGFDWFFTKLYHGVIMASGVTSMNKVKLVYTTVIQSMISTLVVIAGYQIFEKMMFDVMNANYHWITKTILLFVGGFITILGSSAVNKGFGLDDGTNFMLKSFMLTRALGRGYRGLKRSIGNKWYGTKGAYNDLYDSAKKNTASPSQIPKPQPQVKPQTQLQPQTDPSRLLENREPAGLLGNRDFDNENIYGGDNMDPGYHVRDIKDQWNDELDKNVADKIARYGQGSELQSDIEDRVGSQTYNNLPIQDAEFTEKTIEPNKPVPFKTIDYGKYKTYEQYKKDFAKGDESVLNPNYKEPSSYHKLQQKTLPDWFNNQDVVNIPGYTGMSSEEKQVALKNIDYYNEQADLEERNEHIETLKKAGYSEDELSKMSNDELNKKWTDNLKDRLRRLGESQNNSKE